MYRLASTTPLRAELEIKRSRFIAIAQRANTVEAAREVLARAREEFPDARHHCSAYVISQEDAQPVLNSSDDGEPAGTAGRPMLAVLTGHELTDISVVVVRYFGGTLLGTGGLVQAYSDSVRQVLDGAKLVTQHRETVARIHLEHAVAGKIEAEIRARGYGVVNTEYDANGMNLEVSVPDFPSFEITLAEISAGRAQAVPAGLAVRESPCGVFPL